MNQEQIIRTIKKNKSFLISTHINPDPDALASELALAMYLMGQHKKVHVINEEDPPSRFMFFPGAHLFKKYPKNGKLPFDVAIILDCGDLNRVGRVQNLIGKDSLIINIDHHITNDFFGNLNLVRPKASSTTELLYDVLSHAKCKMTKSMAMLLYIGIMTDTGSFRYDSTTNHTHEVAGELMKFNFSVSDLYRKIYERISMKDLKMFTHLINKFETMHKGRVVCITLKKNILKKFSEEFDIRDKIFSFLRAIKGVELIIVYSEFQQGKTRVNLRSQGNRVNVAKLACYFGGGGHRKASGCVIDGDMKQAKKKLLTRLKDIL